MPNIIQQQDLLKGLPDDRLSMLMQNPTGDIPPFLVAAEAQRRQSIREQFSGGPQESVVDTLTKQLASVPQNIEAPMQTPPQMPTPQMQAGVGALERGMRDGGMVQRYQDGSLVERYYRYGPRGAGAPITRVGETSLTSGIYNFLFPGGEETAPSGDILSAPTVEELSRISTQRREAEADAGRTREPTMYGMTAAERRGMPLSSPAAPAQKPRDETAGQEDTSEENQSSAQEAAFRKRLDDLYGQTGASDWEKAQKWFAMAGQFVQPSKNIMQNIAAGASAFAEGAAAEQAAARESAIAREKALLEWDMSRYEADRKSRAEIARDELAYQRELAKMGMLSPEAAIKGYTSELTVLQNELEADTPPTPERQAEIIKAMNGIMIAIAEVRKSAGYGGAGVGDMNTMRQLAAGQ
jgi:hypothetical protein